MPALIALQGQPNFLANRENSYRGTPGIAAATLRIRTLNTSPAHAAVQPAVSRARVELEGSTDLETWSVTTNRDFDVSRESRFFRAGHGVKSRHSTNLHAHDASFENHGSEAFTPTAS